MVLCTTVVVGATVGLATMVDDSTITDPWDVTCDVDT